MHAMTGVSIHAYAIEHASSVHRPRVKFKGDPDQDKGSEVFEDVHSAPLPTVAGSGLTLTCEELRSGAAITGWYTTVVAIRMTRSNRPRTDGGGSSAWSSCR